MDEATAAIVTGRANPVLAKKIAENL